MLKLEIPEIEGQLDRIVLEVYRTARNTNVSYEFYVNIGNDNPTPKNYDFIGEEIWNFGKGLVIHNKNNLLETK